MRKLVALLLVLPIAVVRATTQTLITYSPSASAFGSAPTTTLYFTGTPTILFNNSGASFSPSSVNGDAFSVSFPSPALIVVGYNNDLTPTASGQTAIALNAPSTTPVTSLTYTQQCAANHDPSPYKRLNGFCVDTTPGLVQYFADGVGQTNLYNGAYQLTYLPISYGYFEFPSSATAPTLVGSAIVLSGTPTTGPSTVFGKRTSSPSTGEVFTFNLTSVYTVRYAMTTATPTSNVCATLGGGTTSCHS